MKLFLESLLAFFEQIDIVLGVLATFFICQYEFAMLFNEAIELGTEVLEVIYIHLHVRFVLLQFHSDRLVLDNDLLLEHLHHVKLSQKLFFFHRTLHLLYRGFES